MKKRIISFLVIFIVFLLLGQLRAYAFSENDFSIDIPKSYKQDSNVLRQDIYEEYSFKKDNNHFIKIGFIFSSNANVPFDEKTLKSLGESVKEEYEGMDPKGIAEEKRNSGELDITDEDAESIPDSFMVSIEKEEITKISDNKYDCFHFIYKVGLLDYDGFVEYYYIPKDNITYMIEIAAETEEELSDKKLQEALDSIKINDQEESNVEQEEIKETENKEEKQEKQDKFKVDRNILLIAFFSAIVLLVITVIVLIVLIKKNKTK